MADMANSHGTFAVTEAIVEPTDTIIPIGQNHHRSKATGYVVCLAAAARIMGSFGSRVLGFVGAVAAGTGEVVMAGNSVVFWVVAVVAIVAVGCSSIASTLEITLEILAMVVRVVVGVVVFEMVKSAKRVVRSASSDIPPSIGSESTAKIPDYSTNKDSTDTLLHLLAIVAEFLGMDCTGSRNTPPAVIGRAGNNCRRTATTCGIGTCRPLSPGRDFDTLVDCSA